MAERSQRGCLKKRFFVATGIIVFDFELFIGDRCRLVSDFHRNTGRLTMFMIIHREVEGRMTDSDGGNRSKLMARAVEMGYSTWVSWDV